MSNNKVKMWMSDYEVFEEIDFDEVGGDMSEYGTADPNILPSKIPCGGCGAHLHCQVSIVFQFHYFSNSIVFQCAYFNFCRVHPYPGTYQRNCSCVALRMI